MGAGDGAPEPDRPTLPARFAPLFLGLLVAAVLTSLARRPFRAFDTYFHLRFGEEFRHDWSVAHPGQPSIASSNDWVPTQWLPQVALSWTDDVAGTTGLVVAFAASVVAFATATYLLLRRWTSVGPAALLTTIVLYGCLPDLSLRPQVLSYLFLVAVVASWNHAARTGRAPWWLVPLGWLWATSHGMWVLGLGTSAVLAVAVCLERRADRREIVRLLAVPVITVLATCATPVGPRILPAVLLVNSRAQYFDEWRAPELFSAFGLPVLALLVASGWLLARARDTGPFVLALAGLGLAFATYSSRTLPLALVVLACVVAVLAPRRPSVASRRSERVAVAVLAAGVVAVAPLLPVLDRPDDGAAAFSARLGELPDGTVVLTDRTMGAVLLWTEPHLDIPLHGYGDVYTDRELEDYDRLVKVEPGWEETIARLGSRVALLPEDAALAAALEGAGWQVVERADDRVLLAAP